MSEFDPDRLSQQPKSDFISTNQHARQASVPSTPDPHYEFPLNHVSIPYPQRILPLTSAATNDRGSSTTPVPTIRIVSTPRPSPSTHLEAPRSQKQPATASYRTQSNPPCEVDLNPRPHSRGRQPRTLRNRRRRVNSIEVSERDQVTNSELLTRQSPTSDENNDISSQLLSAITQLTRQTILLREEVGQFRLDVSSLVSNFQEKVEEVGKDIKTSLETAAKTIAERSPRNMQKSTFKIANLGHVRTALLFCSDFTSFLTSYRVTLKC